MTTSTHGIPLDWTEKYRPVRLEEVMGQTQAVQSIQSMLKSGPQRPILLAGPIGDGKTTLARIIGMISLCSGAARPCLTCETCRQIRKGAFGQNSDFSSYTEYEGGWLDEDEIHEKFVQPFQEGNRLAEILMIDEVQELSPKMQGMLLKPLEMTTSKSDRRFILCTSEPDRLTKAVRSRCDIVALKHVSAADMGAILKKIALSESMLIEPDAFLEIIFNAGGHVRDAIATLQEVHRRSEGRIIRSEDVRQGQDSKRELAAKIVIALIKKESYKQNLLKLAEEVIGGEMPSLIVESLVNAIRVNEKSEHQIDHLAPRHRAMLSNLPEESLYAMAGALAMPEFSELIDRKQIELFLAYVDYRHRHGHLQ